MPDYAGCMNKTCPLRHKCARYLMVFSEYQSVSNFEAEGCQYFWDIDKGVPFAIDKEKE